MQTKRHTQEQINSDGKFLGLDFQLSVPDVFIKSIGIGTSLHSGPEEKVMQRYFTMNKQRRQTAVTSFRYGRRFSLTARLLASFSQSPDHLGINHFKIDWPLCHISSLLATVALLRKLLARLYIKKKGFFLGVCAPESHDWSACWVGLRSELWSATAEFFQTFKLLLFSF